MTRQQITLLSIFALFLAPVLLVALMSTSWWAYQPEGFSNRGQLVQPPVALPLGQRQQDGSGVSATAFAGKWLLLYVMPENCQRRCTDDIVSLRQVYKATGRQGQHLAIVLLNRKQVDNELKAKIASISEEMHLLAMAPAETLSTLLQINSDLSKEKQQAGTIRTYIVDPLLNVVLAYGEDANPGDISKDLKRLLKWSVQDKTS